MDVEDYAAFPGFDADPLLRKWNLWGYIDGRDGALAVEKALERRGGFDRFVIASPDTVMSRPNADLVAEVFPDVPSTATSGSTTPCCPSTRPAGCSASSRGIPGATTSSVRREVDDIARTMSSRCNRTRQDG